MFTLITAAFAGDEEENWQKFSKSLVEMFKSDNDGLKQSAMMQIITYEDKLDVKDAAYDIYNIYKWHKDEKMRQLALVTLYHIDYDWIIQQLTEDIKKEESPVLKKQMMFIVDDYNKKKQDKEKKQMVSE
jgi:hypothetical protein